MMKKTFFFGSLLLVIFFFVECGSKVSQPKKYIIDVATGPYGTISPSGKFEVLEGQSVTFNIKPEFGYNADLKVDGAPVSLTSPLSYTLPNITSNHQLDGHFNQSLLILLLMSKQWVEDSAEIFQQNTQLWGTYSNDVKPVTVFLPDNKADYYEYGVIVGHPYWSIDETVNPAVLAYGSKETTFKLTRLNSTSMIMSSMQEKFNLIFYAK
jgi:hypothetical protein